MIFNINHTWDHISISTQTGLVAPIKLFNLYRLTYNFRCSYIDSNINSQLVKRPLFKHVLLLNTYNESKRKLGSWV
jgi:hypothetical protein